MSVGPYPVEVGNTDESVITTLSTSWRRCHGSHTLVRGSVPRRAVPITWREIGVGSRWRRRRASSSGGDVIQNVDNVLVTDSSVFPTSTGYGPTLTLVALAIRAARALADLEPLTSSRADAVSGAPRDR